jgi:hypothetical protein
MMIISRIAVERFGTVEHVDLLLLDGTIRDFYSQPLQRDIGGFLEDGLSSLGSAGSKRV